ncbi:MAG: archease [Methanomassiliicoccales archaeon]|nr:MAG: archease [Methanomassiliicoccales archaeon]
MKSYEVFDHTADVGIRAYGKSLDCAFENAAKGMFDIITDVKKVKDVGEYKIELQALDLEQLLVDWLSELLFIHTVKQVLFSEFNVKIQKSNEKWSLMANAKGEDFDSKKHPYHTEIKAVTHHILEIKQNDVYRVQILFDI